MERVINKDLEGKCTRERIGPTSAASCMDLPGVKRENLTTALAMYGYLKRASGNNTSKAKWIITDTGRGAGFEQVLSGDELYSGSITAPLSNWIKVVAEVGLTSIQKIREVEALERGFKKKSGD